ncbi:hypothetical protein E2320_018056, partial [Naja naja]
MERCPHLTAWPSDLICLLVLATVSSSSFLLSNIYNILAGRVTAGFPALGGTSILPPCLHRSCSGEVCVEGCRDPKSSPFLGFACETQSLKIPAKDCKDVEDNLGIVETTLSPACTMKKSPRVLETDDGLGEDANAAPKGAAAEEHGQPPLETPFQKEAPPSPRIRVNLNYRPGLV